jgi:serine/threonine protein kinase
MAYYEGESLKDKIDRGPMPLAQAIDFATQVAQGLAKVHAKGIVHRDIKPANIMVTNEGTAKICDFGIAKLASMIGFSKMGTTIGTPAYISPEQARGKEVDHRSDIWSLGVLLYEMLTGKLPFREKNEQALMYAILHEEPEPITASRPEAPVSLQQVVAKAMAKDPQQRYLNLEAMLRDLRSLQKELQPETMPASFREKPQSFLYTGAAILMILMLAGAILLWQQKNNVARPGGKKASEDVAAFKRNRIAVLPFANISSAAGDEFLADGMTDELISTLSRNQACPCA